MGHKGGQGLALVTACLPRHERVPAGPCSPGWGLWTLGVRGQRQRPPWKCWGRGRVPRASGLHHSELAGSGLRGDQETLDSALVWFAGWGIASQVPAPPSRSAPERLSQAPPAALGAWGGGSSAGACSTRPTLQDFPRDPGTSGPAWATGSREPRWHLLPKP